MAPATGRATKKKARGFGSGPGFGAWRFPTFARQTAALSSAQGGFTSGFGMGPGGARPLWSPSKSVHSTGQGAWPQGGRPPFRRLPAAVPCPVRSVLCAGRPCRPAVHRSARQGAGTRLALRACRVGAGYFACRPAPLARRLEICTLVSYVYFSVANFAGPASGLGLFAFRPWPCACLSQAHWAL
jgi:hypothetical protein